MSEHKSAAEVMESFLASLEVAFDLRRGSQFNRVQRVDIDLSSITTTRPLPFNGSAYGIVVPTFNAPAGASVRAVVDGVEVILQPGAKLRTAFQRVEFFNTSQGANIGTLTVYLLLHPMADYFLGEGGAGNLQFATYTAPHNVTTEVPTLATQGVSLAGGKGARAAISAAGAATITSGTAVWWLYDDVQAKWAESSVTHDMARATARNAIAVPDEFVTVGRGRAFLEIRSGVNSGAGIFTVSLFAN